MCSLWPHSRGVCYSRWSWGWVRSPCRQKACQCNTQCSVSASQGSLKKRKCRHGLCVGDESLKVAEFWWRATAGVEKAFQVYKTQAHTYAYIHTHTHRHGPMGYNRKRNSTQQTQQQGQRDSEWVWMMSWVAPFSRAWRRVPFLNGFWEFSWQPQTHNHPTSYCSGENALPETQYKHKCTQVSINTQLPRRHACMQHTEHHSKKPFITLLLIDCQNRCQRFVRAMHKSVFLYTGGFCAQVAFTSIINGACQFSRNLKAAKSHGLNPAGKEEPSQLIQPFIWTEVPSLPQGAGWPQKS